MKKLLIITLLTFALFSNSLMNHKTNAASTIKYEYNIVDCGGTICAKDQTGNQELRIAVRKTAYSSSNIELEIIDDTNVNGITVLNIGVYVNTMSIHPSNSNTRIPEVNFLANSQSGYFDAWVTGNVKISQTASGLDNLILFIKGSLENSSTIGEVLAEQISSPSASKYFINNGVILYDSSAYYYDEFVNNGYISNKFYIYDAIKIKNTRSGYFGSVEIASRQGTMLEFTNQGLIQELTASARTDSQTGNLMPDGNYKIVNEPSGNITIINSSTTNTIEIINKGSIPGRIDSVDNPNFSFANQGSATSPMITVGSTTYPPGTATVGPPISPSGSLSPSGSTPSGGSSTGTIDKKKEPDKIIKDFEKFMKAKPSKTKIEKTTASYISKIYKLWPNNANSTTYIKKLINTGVKYLKQLSKNNRLPKEKAFLLKAAKSVKLDKAVPPKVKGKTLTKAQKTKWKNDRIKSVKKTVAKYGVSKLKSADKSTVKNYLKSKLKLNF